MIRGIEKHINTTNIEGATEHLLQTVNDWMHEYIPNYSTRLSQDGWETSKYKFPLHQTSNVLNQIDQSHAIALRDDCMVASLYWYLKCTYIPFSEDWRRKHGLLWLIMAITATQNIRLLKSSLKTEGVIKLLVKYPTNNLITP